MNANIKKRISKKKNHKFYQPSQLISLSDKTPSYKIALFGDKEVGKTCMLKQIYSQSFSSVYEPTISEVYETQVQTKNKKTVKLTLFDTSGSMEFPAMTRLTMTKCDANIVVYSVTSLKSLEVAKRKLSEITKVKGEGSACVLVGNKCDVFGKSREVSFETGLRCAVTHKCAYVEVSALCNMYLMDAFEIVIKKLVYLKRLLHHQQQELLVRSKTIDLFEIKRSGGFSNSPDKDKLQINRIVTVSKRSNSEQREHLSSLSSRPRSKSQALLLRKRAQTVI